MPNMKLLSSGLSKFRPVGIKWNDKEFPFTTLSATDVWNVHHVVTSK